MPALVKYMQAAAFTVGVLILYPLCRLFATYAPSICKTCVAWFFKRCGIGAAPDEIVKTMASGLWLQAQYGPRLGHILYGEAEVGKPAPNLQVVKMDGVTQVNLLDFAKAGRPLVLNFGSCSWPPFMEKLAEVARMSREFESVADFVTIYIQEAHATDGFKLDSNAYKIANHKRIQNRIIAAQMLEEQKPAGQLVVDTMSDDGNKLYRSWPERLCVVVDGIVQYYGRIGPWGYQPSELEKWLKDYSAKQK